MDPDESFQLAARLKSPCKLHSDHLGVPSVQLICNACANTSGRNFLLHVTSVALAAIVVHLSAAQRARMLPFSNRV